jgi:hypothetical protein
MKAWSASAAVVRVIFLAPDALTSEESGFVVTFAATHNIPFTNQAANHLCGLPVVQLEIPHHPLLAESVGVPSFHVSTKPPNECWQTSDGLPTPNLDCHDSAASEL